MKKILITSLFCSAALFMSACSDENKELSQDAFKFDFQNNKKFNKRKDNYLFLTAKDDIEIKRITANRGTCMVGDIDFGFDKLDTIMISQETPVKMCYDDILNSGWISSCGEIVGWATMSKEDCNYKYKFDLTNNFERINEKLEKTQDLEYIESCERTKKIAKEKHNGKYYYDYKKLMKFGETKKFYIDDNCPELLEFSVYTNKGVVTYSVN